MEEYMIYEDINGNLYVKGDIGGGNTINCKGEETMNLWNYCFMPEEMILQFCKNTNCKIKLN